MDECPSQEGQLILQPLEFFRVMFLKYNLYLFSLYLQCPVNSYPIQLNLFLSRDTGLFVPKSEKQD